MYGSTTLLSKYNCKVRSMLSLYTALQYVGFDAFIYTGGFSTFKDLYNQWDMSPHSLNNCTFTILTLQLPFGLHNMPVLLDLP